MLQPEVETVSLTEDGYELLMAAYRSRRRILLPAYAVLMLLALMCTPGGLHPAYWGRPILPQTPYEWRMWFFVFVFLETPLAATGIYFYRKRALSLKLDAESGVKERIPIVILEKKYFPLTGQYFFMLNDTRHLSNEVDASTYEQLKVGDYAYLYRGARSKFVLG